MCKRAKRAHVQQWHMCSNGTCARFNSKLVRLEADTRTCAAMAHVRASIPNWFELEV